MGDKKEVKVLNYGHPLLRGKAEEVKELSVVDRVIIDDMLKVVDQFPALGLAAPQVGHNKRIIVVNTIADVIVIINPVITSFSEEESMSTEGCLSILGATEEVSRPNKVMVSGLDPDFNEVGYEWEGVIAHIVQHEIDHLDGIMMVDHLKEFKRKRMLKKHRQYIRNNHMPVNAYSAFVK